MMSCDEAEILEFKTAHIADQMPQDVSAICDGKKRQFDVFKAELLKVSHHLLFNSRT